MGHSFPNSCLVRFGDVKDIPAVLALEWSGIRFVAVFFVVVFLFYGIYGNFFYSFFLISLEISGLWCFVDCFSMDSSWALVLRVVRFFRPIFVSYFGFWFRFVCSSFCLYGVVCGVNYRGLLSIPVF